VPLIGLGFIIIISTGLLIRAVKKLRVLCGAFRGVCESKRVVRVILTLFSLENICLILCLSIQFAYAKQQRPVLYLVASIFHFFALIVASFLLTFVVLIIIRLS
jgi:uncharacterized membrane protein